MQLKKAWFDFRIFFRILSKIIQKNYRAEFQNFVEPPLKRGMKKTAELLTRTLTELLCGIWQKCGKTENRTERKKTSDFHSAEQKHNRNLSRFAELKNDGILSNSEKINQRKTKISEQNYKRTKSTKTQQRL